MENITTIILMVILLLCTHLWTYHAMTNHIKQKNGNSKMMAGVVLALIFGCILGYCLLLCKMLNDPDLVVYLILVIISSFGILWMVWFLIQNRKRIRFSMVVLFVLYFAVVLYVTLWSRQGSTENTINMNVMKMITEAVWSNSMKTANHFFMNIAMFVPLSFFFSAIENKTLARIKTVFLMGLSLSTVIESLQLMLQCGECDINDIIANALGAVIGWGIYSVMHREKII